MKFDLDNLIRPNIRRLKPYSSARSEFIGTAEIFLDANENAFFSPAGDGYNRYPDPLQTELKKHIARINDVAPSNIFIGNGSDEAIDLLFRVFCQPGRDACIICPPTYGMYKVSADINDVKVREVRLTGDFQLNVKAILEQTDDAAKLVFLCSPNNPTGNLMRREDVVELASQFDGLVIVDEAYIHFAEKPSFIRELQSLPNMIVLQTFSKAWGMASLRVGVAFASDAIINLMNRVKPPYNVSGTAQGRVLDALENNEIQIHVAEIVRERMRLERQLANCQFVEHIYPSDANFILVKTTDANAIYRHLIGEKIVVRNRNNVELCEGCIRITVGTIVENGRLLNALRNLTQIN